MSNLSNHFTTQEAITKCPTCPTISGIESEISASVQPVQPFWMSDVVKILQVSNLSNHFPTSHTYTKKKYMYMYMYIVHGSGGILVGQVGQLHHPHPQVSSRTAPTLSHPASHPVPQIPRATPQRPELACHACHLVGVV